MGQRLGGYFLFKMFYFHLILYVFRGPNLKASYDGELGFSGVNYLPELR